MHEVLFFMIGLMFGGMFGIILMCLLQVNRHSGKGQEDE